MCQPHCIPASLRSSTEWADVLVIIYIYVPDSLNRLLLCKNPGRFDILISVYKTVVEWRAWPMDPFFALHSGFFRYCFDTGGWATGRAPSLSKPWHNPQKFLSGIMWRNMLVKHKWTAVVVHVCIAVWAFYASGCWCCLFYWARWKMFAMTGFSELSQAAGSKARGMVCCHSDDSFAGHRAPDASMSDYSRWF